MATLKTSCILAHCRKRISRKRQRRNAITCSPRCQKQLVKLRKEERDKRVCHHCGHPSTEAERQKFRKWRASERNQAKSKPTAGNGIPTSAKGIEEHAYVCPPRSPKPRKRKEGFDRLEASR